MKKQITQIACIALAFVTPIFAASTVDMVGPITVKNGTTTTTATLTTADTGNLNGFVSSVSIDVSGGADVQATNSVTTNPSIIGYYHVTGTFMSSNKYAREAGTYYLWYTNSLWYITRGYGTTTGPVFTNRSELGTFTAQSSATGTVVMFTATPDFDVDVTTIASQGHGPARTVLSMDDVTADGLYYPRPIADTTAGVDISNVPVEFPVGDEKLRVSISDCNATNTDVDVYIFLRRN